MAMNHNNQSGLAYHVVVIRTDEANARALNQAHELTLNIKKGSSEAGFNAAETLLAALGTCLLTNVNAISQKMHIQIEDARVELDAVRRDEPPALTKIRYRLVLKSPEPHHRMQELADLCFKWGTVTNTLIQGITPQGELVIEDANPQGE